MNKIIIVWKNLANCFAYAEFLVAAFLVPSKQHLANGDQTPSVHFSINGA